MHNIERQKQNEKEKAKKQNTKQKRENLRFVLYANADQMKRY